MAVGATDTDGHKLGGPPGMLVEGESEGILVGFDKLGASLGTEDGRAETDDNPLDMVLGSPESVGYING